MATPEYFGLEMPMMIDVEDWYKWWPAILSGGVVPTGVLTPEVIPDGVFWATTDKVLVVDTDGSFLLQEP